MTRRRENRLNYMRPTVGRHRTACLAIALLVLVLAFLPSSKPLEEFPPQKFATNSHFQRGSAPGLAAINSSESYSPLPDRTSELPNGPPGQAVQMSFKEAISYFVPLRKRENRAALDKIFDVAALDCEGTAAEVDGRVETVATLFGRTRLTVTLKRCKAIVGEEIETVDGWLRLHAPSWYVAAASVTKQEFVLKRRAKLFTFCIGGGKDGRANYVEFTWGQRTPIQWFTDEWSDQLRPIVDLHPMYVKDPFGLLTYKVSRVWQRVFKDYGHGDYDWFVRLWDDNYFLEENAYNVLGRMPLEKPLMVGKIGWRNMGKAAVYPFAGGGAGWFLNKAGMRLIGPTIPDGEKWFMDFRSRRDIFLKHHIHDEDVFHTAWFHEKGVKFQNGPGLEHVSPGNEQKQRCMSDEALYRLRWKANETIYFDYPAHEEEFRMEAAWYAYTKPIVWHYMSPRRLVKLETLLYQTRREEFKNVDPPKTNADLAKKNRQCYPGVPDPAPPRGLSMFEKLLPDPPTLLF